MSRNRTNTRRPITFTLVAALAVPLLAAAGCGTDQETFVKKSDTPPTTTETRTAPVETATPAPEAPAPTPAPVTEVTYSVAETAFLEGRYGEAVDLFTRYTERESKNAWGYYMLGLSAWKDGRLETAESAFKQSLALDPGHVKSCLNLSRVLLEGRRPTEALATIDRALALDSASSTAYRLRGLACHDLGRTSDAVAAYQSAIHLDPQDAWSMNNLALLRIEEGRFEDALPALARAVELRKDVAVFYNNLGMALEHTGRYTEATDAYASAVNVEPSNQKAVQNHDRVAAVRQHTGIEPVDLTALARAFETTIETWTVSYATAPSDSTVSAQSE